MNGRSPDLLPVGQDAAFLLWRPPADELVADYQLDIIRHLKHLLIPAVKVITDERFSLLFCVQGLRSLEQSLLAKSPDRSDLLRVIASAARAMIICEDQLLDPAQLILDTSRIYCASGTNPYRDLLFICLPADDPAASPPTSMMTGILSDFISVLETEAGLKKALGEEDMEQLRRLAAGEPAGILRWAQNKEADNWKPARHRLRNRLSTGAAAGLPDQPDSEQGQFSPAALFRKPSGIAIVGADLLLLICLTLTLGIALRGGGLPFYLITGIGLFLLITSDVLLLLQFRKQTDVQDTRFEQERRHQAVRQAILDAGSKPVVKTAGADTPDCRADELSLACLYPSDGTAEDAADLLGGRRKRKAAAVMLNREFYIGTDRDRCDFTPSSPNLSPIHARITRQDGSWLLTDLASDGGTWLNETRLHYYEDYVLFSGARIRFAAEYFVFLADT